MTLSMSLEGKTVLVTGASSGIGAAIAELCASAGATVVATARRAERLEALVAKIKKEHNTAAYAVTLDVSNDESVSTLFDRIPSEAQNIDVLVNNAGLALGMDKVQDVPLASVDVMLGTNVRGLVAVTQVVLSKGGLLARGQGHVINVSSVSAHDVYAGGSIYCATKHAVDAITRTLRVELSSTGINVCAIEPGLVRTEFSNVRLNDTKRADNVYAGFEPLTAEDVAETVVFVASRRKNVQVAQLLVFPTAQASGTHVHRVLN